MDIAMYFGSGPGDLRVKAGDLSRAVSELRDGRRTVEQAQQQELPGERYGFVGTYDPVLRAHCRLDQEG
jgi:hypothetical protein